MSPLPLQGKKCLITRQSDQAKELIEMVNRFGGIPISIPLISFRPTELSEKDRIRIEQLYSYDWLVVTSQNGVNYFFERMKELHLSLPEKLKIAAVGTKTKAALEKHGLHADLIPENFTGDDLAHTLRKYVSTNERVLIVKGNLARDVIYKELIANGIKAEEWVVYETFFPEESKDKLIETMKNNHLDILIFTSPSTVEHFMETINEQQLSHKIKDSLIACIGPITKRKAESYGLTVSICPTVYTIEQLMQDLIQTIT